MFRVWGLSIPKAVWVLITVELFLLFLCMNISINMSYDTLSFQNTTNNSIILLLVALLFSRYKR